MTLAIETNDLVRRYGQVTAVDHLSLRVAQGEIYAFRGLNGAGKTTTIRLRCRGEVSSILPKTGSGT